MKKNNFYLTIISILILISCRDDLKLATNSRSLFNTSVTATISDSTEIFNQLRWIARGLPDLISINSNYKSEIHSIVENSNSFVTSNEDIQLEISNTLSNDYKIDVYDRVNTHFSNNDANSDYFFEININGCKRKVGILIPDVDDVDVTLQHVCMPTQPFDDEKTSYWGYFQETDNAGNDHIDSVLVTDDNRDSFYLWIVVLDEDCNDTGATAQHCGNEVYEPWLGETVGSGCPDAMPVTLRTGPDVYTLRLKNIHVKTDKKGYSSSHPDNKYQSTFFQKYLIRWGFQIWTPRPQGDLWPLYDAMPIVDLSAPLSNNWIVHPEKLKIKDGKYWHARKKDGNKLKRCKKNRRNKTKCNKRSNEWTDDLNYFMIEDYKKSTDTLLFCLYEWDNMALLGQAPYTQHIEPTSGVPMQNGRRQYGLHEYWVLNQNHGHSYSFVGGQNAATPHISDEYAVVLPNSPDWVPNGQNGFEIVLPLDGEMSVTLELVK